MSVHTAQQVGIIVDRTNKMGQADENSTPVNSEMIRQELTNGQPGVRGLDLAAWLGDERSVSNGVAIRRNRLKIRALGIIRTVKTIHQGAGRPKQESLLIEEQPIAVYPLGQTPRAIEGRDTLHRLTVETRRSTPTPTTSSTVVGMTPADFTSSVNATRWASRTLDVA